MSLLSKAFLDHHPSSGHDEGPQQPSVALLTSLQHCLSCHLTFIHVISWLMSTFLPKLENPWQQRSFVVSLTTASLVPSVSGADECISRQVVQPHRDSFILSNANYYSPNSNDNNSNNRNSSCHWSSAHYTPGSILSCLRVLCFPKTATAIYLLLHILLHFPSNDTGVYITFPWSSVDTCDCPDQQNLTKVMVCVLWRHYGFHCLSFSLEMLILGASHHVASKHRPHGETTCRCFSWQLQVGVPTSTAKHVQDCKMSPSSAAISLQLHSRPWARNTLVSPANL